VISVMKCPLCGLRLTFNRSLRKTDPLRWCR
jgi:hypothetical protein